MLEGFPLRHTHRVRRRLHTIYPTLYRLRYGSRLLLGKNLRFIGLPVIHVCEGASIAIGDGVTLNSTNRGYHALLHSPVKLMADRIGASIEIGENTRIHGSCLHAYKRISVGRNCLVAANCNIMDGSGHDVALDRVEERLSTTGDAREITIEDAVWIGMNCIILPGAHIGYGSVIAAGSVVRGEVPAYCLVAGNPAQVVEQYRDKRRESAQDHKK